MRIKTNFRLSVECLQITEFATNTLVRIKEKTGYTPEETVQMMKNYIWMDSYHARDNCYKIILIAFGLAKIKLDLWQPDIRSHNRGPPPPYSKTDPSLDKKAKESKDLRLFEKLDRLHREIAQHQKNLEKVVQEINRLHGN